MKNMKLFTGGGVSISPEYAQGRTESVYVRLVADDGKMLQKGKVTTVCIDVLATEAGKWSEVDYVEPEDEPTADEILDIIMGVSE